MLVFNNIRAFSAQLPLFSKTFPLGCRLWKADPLFSITFPHRSFILEELFFSFSSRKGLVVHLEKGSFPGPAWDTPESGFWVHGGIAA
jgi:hypothetical protein